MSMYSDLEHKHELGAEATRCIKQQTNQVYSPVISTRECASHLAVDESTALDALTVSYETGYISRKEVAENTFVWW